LILTINTIGWSNGLSGFLNLTKISKLQTLQKRYPTTISEIGKLGNISFFIKGLKPKSFVSPIAIINSNLNINDLKKKLESLFKIKIDMIGKRRKRLVWKFYEIIPLPKNRFIFGNKLTLKDIIKKGNFKKYTLPWRKKLPDNLYGAISLNFKKTDIKKIKTKSSLMKMIIKSRMLLAYINDEKVEFTLPQKFLNLSQNKVEKILSIFKSKFKTIATKNNMTNITREIASIVQNSKTKVDRKSITITLPLSKNFDFFLSSIIDNTGKSSTTSKNESKKYVERKICMCNMNLLKIAVGLWRLNNPQGNDIDVQKLIEEGYLKTSPICPSGGTYTIMNNDEDDYYIKCSKHGRN
jgi:hypothetical protein